MYICICNALKDSEIARAIEGGAACADDAFECFGCTPKCGRCIIDIEEKIERRKSTTH
jgi:bacterioferritin-associated ferredoxin